MSKKAIPWAALKGHIWDKAEGNEIAILNRMPDDTKFQYRDMMASVTGSLFRGMDERAALNAAALGAVRTLTYVKQQVIEKEYDDLYWRQMAPIATDAPWWSSSVENNYKEVAGEAVWTEDGFTGSLPEVEVDTASAPKPVRTAMSAFSFTPMELARATALGMPLKADKAMAARRAIEEKLETANIFGVTALGINGFLTSGQGVTMTEVAPDTGGDHLWSGKTVDDIIKDIVTCVYAPVLASKGRYIPNRLILPLTAVKDLVGTKLSTVSDSNAYEFVISKIPFIRQENIMVVGTWAETAGTGSTRIMAAYNSSDAQAVEFDLVQDFTMLAADVSSLKTLINCQARTAGITIKKPLSMSLYYGF
jgi:hypothetical protein